MRRYHRVKADTGERRSFTITVGTVPGYKSATEPLANAGHLAVAAVQVWIGEQIGRQAPYLTGILTPGTLVYGWPIPENPAYGMLRDEPVLTFSGEVSPLYAAHLTDAQVVDLLTALADRLGATLEQERVYVAYREATWVLEADDANVPRRAGE